MSLSAMFAARFPLREAGKAMELAESRTVRGKVVLVRDFVMPMWSRSSTSASRRTASIFADAATRRSSARAITGVLRGRGSNAARSAIAPYGRQSRRGR